MWTLMAPYFVLTTGGRWGGDGNLTAVPVASKSELQRIIDNPKSSCNHAFPTKVKTGLLYVWPVSGSNAQVLCCSVRRIWIPITYNFVLLFAAASSPSLHCFPMCLILRHWAWTRIELSIHLMYSAKRSMCWMLLATTMIAGISSLRMSLTRLMFNKPIMELLEIAMTRRVPTIPL
jgi:hypothetical protein